ncbi:MAG: hypothetical protein KKF33_11210 [Alphaproteobacteria bacterium]|nr:hypothetical protein [Alphaproteobacteria bacterium]
MIRTAFAIALVATSAYAAVGSIPSLVHTPTAAAKVVVADCRHATPVHPVCDDRAISRGHADLDIRLRAPAQADAIATV